MGSPIRLPAALVVVAVLLAACGEDGPAAGTPEAATPEAATRARVLEVLAAAPKGGAALAPLARYLGPDRDLRYAKAATYEGEQVRELDSIAARVQRHAALGAPTFVGSETSNQGGREWVAWTLTFGEGENATRVLYAFVNVGDAWLLGDIDNLD